MDYFKEWLAVIWSMVRWFWWIHEVLIRSISTWGQCFVTGSTGCAGLGGVQGHVKELLLQEPRQVLCTTRRKAEREWASCWKIETGISVSSPCQWEMCKIWWAKAQQEIFGSETKTSLGKLLGCWVTSAHPIRSWLVWKWGYFYKLNWPLWGQQAWSVLWEVVAPTPSSTQLKTPVSLHEAQGGIYFLQKSIIWVVGQESFYTHTHSLKKLSPVFPCFPFCH